MKQERTWKDVVTDALQQLGGEAHLREIISIAKDDPKALKKKYVAEKVRQVVRAYKIFESAAEGSGVYRLVADATSTITAKKTTSDVTDEIQGKLLAIGKANDFETFAPSNDCTKRTFDGKSLANFATVRSILENPRFKENELKRMAQIDVLWLTEVDGDLLPRFAFEIENSTKVLAGLNRLSVIPSFFNTKLFIVGENDSQKKRYEKFLKEATFKGRAERFQFKYFEDIRDLFNYSDAYDKARAANEEAMRDAGMYE
jgi:KaiC/GvpD/RAD55 family RecA-like ATPase